MDVTFYFMGWLCRLLLTHCFLLQIILWLRYIFQLMLYPLIFKNRTWKYRLVKLYYLSITQKQSTYLAYPVVYDFVVMEDWLGSLLRVEKEMLCSWNGMLWALPKRAICMWKMNAICCICYRPIVYHFVGDTLISWSFAAV